MTSTHPGPRPFSRIIAALHLPAFDAHAPSMAWLEDYVLSNVEVFVKGGIDAVKIQDQTREHGAANPRSVARLAALTRLVRRTYPDLSLGVIVQAHDAVAPLAVADAADADFVRLKVFVGAVLNAEGQRDALSLAATAARAEMGRPDIAILADVHDRTSHPLGDVPHETAATWAQKAGADALVITGHDFADSLTRIEAARAAGVTWPVFVGGGVTADNVRSALDVANGVVVSTSIMRKDPFATDLVRWDLDAVRHLVDQTVGR